MEKVARTCVNFEGFANAGLDVVAARTPAGTCYPNPQFGGVQGCVCTYREFCNDLSFIGKNDLGQYLPSQVKPDVNGNLVPSTGSGTPGSISGSISNSSSGLASGLSSGSVTAKPADGSVDSSGGDTQVSGSGDTIASGTDEKNKAASSNSGDTAGSKGGASGGGSIHRSCGYFIVLLYMRIIVSKLIEHY